MCVLLMIVAALLSVLLVAVTGAAPSVFPPLNWLPEAKDAGPLLGTLLAGQSAIAALTLAVTLFLMQGSEETLTIGCTASTYDDRGCDSFSGLALPLSV